MDEEIQTVKVQVIAANYWWKKGKRLERIYITTEPATTVFFDMHKHEWVSKLPQVDVAQVSEDVLKLYKVSSTEELIARLKKGNRL